MAEASPAPSAPSASTSSPVASAMASSMCLRQVSSEPGAACRGTPLSTKLGVPRKPTARASATLAETALSVSGSAMQAVKPSSSSPRFPASSVSAGSSKAPRSGRKPSSAWMAKRRLAYSQKRSCAAAQTDPRAAVVDSVPTTGRWRNSMRRRPGRTYSSTRNGSCSAA